MCGLFGIATLGQHSLTPELIARAERATACLEHRGPDQAGSFVSNRVYIGHTRLSIIDLSEAGRQPMRDPDSTLVIAVNGEIYNHEPLREELGVRRFRSSSDSEVVLHGYEQWGMEKMLDRLDGMYAGVVYDQRARRLWLFRDRVGVKPLYVARLRVDGRESVLWASELKAIASMVPDLSIEPSAILDFAAQRCMPGGKTLYRDVEQLRPGCCLRVDLDDARVSQQRYWQLDPEALAQPPAGSVDDYGAHIRELVAGSVREQLVADVPVGLFLSGGMDSSILCEAASGTMPDLATFTIGFDVPQHDESGYAALVAERFRTRHHQETLSGHYEFDLFDQLNQWYDEPFGDLSALPTARVCELARRHSTVALSGDGGDELFGGYRWYQRFWRYRRFNGWLPSSRSLDVPFYRPPSGVWQKVVNRLALLGQLDPLNLYSGVMSNLLTAELAPLREWLEVPSDYDYLWSLRPHYHPELGRHKALQYLDFHTFLPDDILTKVDRVSMAVSLEVRVPLLSRSLVEYAFRLPESFLWLDGEPKGGLKHAYRDHLPPEILQRDKRGFSVPVDWWKEGLLEGEPNCVYYYLTCLRSRGLEAIRT